MRFLFSRRWILFAATVALLAWCASLLGQWQFHRLDERRAENALVRRNLDEIPVPIDTLLSVGHGATAGDEWRKVVVTGTWDDTHTIVLKYQTRDGGPGIDVITPLRTASGAAVLVDRGWLKTENVGSIRPDLPAATPGEVTVIGWIRVDATGDATLISDLATRAVSSSAAAKVLPYPLYGGFLDISTESPRPVHGGLAPTELPDDSSEGPHFFYGLQWWFFGALAVFGFGYLAYDERRQLLERRRREAAGTAPEGTLDDPDEESDAPQEPAVHGQHDAGDER